MKKISKKASKSSLKKIANGNVIVTNQGAELKDAFFLGNSTTGDELVINPETMTTPAHKMLFGFKNSGKTESIVIPYLERVAERRESILILDPNKELLNRTLKIYRERNYNIKCIDLCLPSESEGIEYISMLGSIEDITRYKHKAYLLAKTLLSNAFESSQPPSAIEASALLVQAVIIYLAVKAKEKGNSFDMETVCNLFWRGRDYVEKLFSPEEMDGDIRASLPVYGDFLEQIENAPEFNYQATSNFLTLFSQFSFLAKKEVPSVKEFLNEPSVYIVSFPSSDYYRRSFAAAYLRLFIENVMELSGAGEQAQERKPCNVLLESQPLLGCIWGMDDWLVESRLKHTPCDIFWVVNHIAELQANYPDTYKSEILNSFSVLLSCGFNEQATAQYFLEAGTPTQEKKSSGLFSIFGKKKPEPPATQVELFQAGTSSVFAVFQGEKQGFLMCKQKDLE